MRLLFCLTHSNHLPPSLPLSFSRRPTRDNYKSVVVLNLDIPSNVADFEDKLRDQLQRYHLIGRQSASLDEEFSFRSYGGKSLVEFHLNLPLPPPSTAHKPCESQTELTALVLGLLARATTCVSFQLSLVSFKLPPHSAQLQYAQSSFDLSVCHCIL